MIKLGEKILLACTVLVLTFSCITADALGNTTLSMSDIVNEWVEKYLDTPHFDTSSLEDSQAGKKVDAVIALRIASDYIIDNFDFTIDHLHQSHPQLSYWDVGDAWVINIAPQSSDRTFTIHINAETGIVIEASFNEASG